MRSCCISALFLPIEDILNLGICCKVLNSISCDSSLWKWIYIRTWERDEKKEFPEMNWIQEFKNKVLMEKQLYQRNQSYPTFGEIITACGRYLQHTFLDSVDFGRMKELQGDFHL